MWVGLGGVGWDKGSHFVSLKFFGGGCPGQELSHFSVYQVLPKLCRWFLKKREREKEREGKRVRPVLFAGQNSVV